VLPGLSDREDQLREVVEACAAAGAVSVSGVALHLRGPLRGHYLDWLESQRPDLVGVHRVRFRRGAYQPDEERERIASVVREAALRCGVTGRDRYRGARSRQTGHHPAPPAEPEPTASRDEGGEQLSLL
jgi:DNA repair photolyase